jgi:hypothetical protein
MNKSLKTLVEQHVSDPISCSDAVCDLIPFFLKLLHTDYLLSLFLSLQEHRGIGKGTSSHGGGHSSVPITTWMGSNRFSLSFFDNFYINLFIIIICFICIIKIIVTY